MKYLRIHFNSSNFLLYLPISYINGRIQKIHINRTRYVVAAVSVSMSILVPFLFFSYINDLLYFVGDKHGIVLLAVDTVVLFIMKTQFRKYDGVNNAISKVVYWFNVNNLLNRNKTKLIKFSTHNDLHTDTLLYFSEL